MTLTFLSLLILAAASWPALRLLSIPPFRRSYTCFALRVAGLLALYVAGLVAVTLWLPMLLPFGAAVAVIGLLAERWRARPDHGRGRRLPPGSLSLVPRAPWVDEAFYRKEACRLGPVFKMSLFLRPMVCIVGNQRALGFFRDNHPKLRAPLVRFSTFIPRGFIRHMEPEDHAEYRKLLQSSIGHTFDPALRDRVEDLVRRGIDRMARDSTAAGDRGIHPRAFVEEMLLGIFIEIFLGVRHDSPTYRSLARLYERVDIRKSSCGSADPELRAAEEIASVIRHQAAELAEQGQSHSTENGTLRAPSSILAQVIASDPKRRDDATLLLNLVYMIQVGRYDLSGLLGWTIQMLADNAQWLDAVAREDEDATPESGTPLAARIIRETLRLEQSEFLYRKTTSDVTCDGFTIPKGWMIRICIRDGHRDPEVFRDPDRFDPDRFLDPQFPKEAYHPLGFMHQGCLGGRIIDLIGTAFVRHLATRYRVEKVTDGPRQYGRAHWEPSSRLRLRFRPRDSAHDSAAEGVVAEEPSGAPARSR